MPATLERREQFHHQQQAQAQAPPLSSQQTQPPIQSGLGVAGMSGAVPGQGNNGGGANNNSNHHESYNVGTRSRADVDLLSMLGLQKGTSSDQAGGYGGGMAGGAGGASGGGGGASGAPGGIPGGAPHQQFAFHEPHPGNRRMRNVNGGATTLALDPRARARALSGVGVPAGAGVPRKLAAVRPGLVGSDGSGGVSGGMVGSGGAMSAEDMERIVTGS